MLSQSLGFLADGGLHVRLRDADRLLVSSFHMASKQCSVLAVYPTPGHVVPPDLTGNTWVKALRKVQPFPPFELEEKAHSIKVIWEKPIAY